MITTLRNPAEWSSPKTQLRERRAFPRSAAKGSASYRPGGSRFGASLSATLVDISQGGIGLIVRKPIEPGQVLEIELTSAVGRKSFRCEVEVRWIQAKAQGEYRVGCCWEHRLSYADWREFARS